MRMATTAKGSLDFQTYIQLLRTRKWWLMLAFILGTTCAVLYSYRLPPLYRASTLILVEPQRIPAAYVSSTVTSTVQERLSTISQQILSRTNLERIIVQFNLYQHQMPVSNRGPSTDGRQQSTGELLRYRFRQLMGRILPMFDQSVPPMEALVERMRKDIDVKVMGGNNAFSIAYVGSDPLTVMKVTNILASLFIDENLRIREQQAQGTSEFLANEHAEAKKELEKQENALKEFKEQRMGALPEQMTSNLRTLDRLQVELQTINDSLKSAEDRKVLYQAQLADLEKQYTSMKPGVSIDTGLTLLLSRIEQLKEELSRLQALYKESYPDIALLKNQILELEEQLAHSGSSEQATKATASIQSPLLSPSFISQRQVIATQLQALNSEIASLRAKQNRTAALIRDYENRVEVTFGHEQQLLDLTRDYEMSRQNYQALLQKRLNARISENLEKRQKAEQFRIIDPAKIPEKPYKPDRVKIIILGSLLSVGAMAGLIFLRDFLKPSYHRPEDFQDTVQLPVLATIPAYKIIPRAEQPLVTQQQPEAPVAEQYRLLYTRIMQATTGKPQTVFAISSAVEGEGKTITSLNLALIAARDFGKQTILIEGDFKNPALLTYVGINSDASLMDVLNRQADLAEAIVNFGHPNLAILPFGHRAKNSASLLSSKEFSDILTRLRERYEMIFIDSPPILSLPDMPIIERLVDEVLLVVRAEKTSKEAVVMGIRSLTTPKLLGIIFNGVQSSSAAGYHPVYNRA
jgi:polysaccharide chain length determinant protein (PEP-CTERM system associated)